MSGRGHQRLGPRPERASSLGGEFYCGQGSRSLRTSDPCAPGRSPTLRLHWTRWTHSSGRSASRCARGGRRAGVPDCGAGARRGAYTSMSRPQRRRSKPVWTEARVRSELEEFLDGATEWPSYRDFRRNGRQTLRNQVTRFGGARLWAKRLGLPYPERKPGYATRWTEDRVRAELSEFLRGRRYWPRRLEFEAAGRKPLRDAVRRLGGSERWAAEFGLRLQNLKSGSIRVWTPERIEAELRRVLDGRDTWPSRRELELNGRAGLASAIAHGEGAAYWACRRGVKTPPRARVSGPRIWTDGRIRGELQEFCRDRTTWPTERSSSRRGRIGSTTPHVNTADLPDGRQS